jgi:hypothetical protein
MSKADYACFYRIAQYESRWRLTSVNPYSGACGLPQANPCSKLESVVPDWRTNVKGSVDWMVNYIWSRYNGSWFAAAFEFGYRQPDGTRVKGYSWY